MILRSVSTLAYVYGFATLGLSYDNSSSIKNDSLSTITPSFNAKILDHNNKDITSSFQILLYSQRPNDPAQLPLPSTDSSSSPLPRRRVLNRLINECPYRHRFISSHCAPLDETTPPAPGALQAYTIVCRHSASGGPPGSRTRNMITRRIGSCMPKEICVDTTSNIEPSNRNYQEDVNMGLLTAPTATCVTDDEFKPWDEHADSNVAQLWAAAMGLTGHAPWLVRAALSRYDKSTPLEVDRLVIEGQPSSSGGDGKERAVCRDCVRLGMKVEGSLEGLNVEARLLTALQVGATGVLWLAAMSG